MLFIRSLHVAAATYYHFSYSYPNSFHRCVSMLTNPTIGKRVFSHRRKSLSSSMPWTIRTTIRYAWKGLSGDNSIEVLCIFHVSIHLDVHCLPVRASLFTNIITDVYANSCWGILRIDRSVFSLECIQSSSIWCAEQIQGDIHYVSALDSWKYVCM